MNKLLFVFSLCCISFSVVNAQITDYKNSIQIGAEYVVLSTPQDYGIRYLTRYGRHLANDRLLVEASVGYLSAMGLQSTFPTDGKERQRLTSELTVLYDLLRSPTHALRIGFGPSVWYRQDYARSVDGQSILVHATDIGAHAVIEYEYRLTRRFTLMGRYGITYFDIPGPNSMGGLAIGYRF